MRRGARQCLVRRTGGVDERPVDRTGIDSFLTDGDRFGGVRRVAAPRADPLRADFGRGGQEQRRESRCRRPRRFPPPSFARPRSGRRHPAARSSPASAPCGRGRTSRHRPDPSFRACRPLPAAASVHRRRPSSLRMRSERSSTAPGAGAIRPAMLRAEHSSCRSPSGRRWRSAMVWPARSDAAQARNRN